eukprot:UN27625
MNASLEPLERDESSEASHSHNASVSSVNDMSPVGKITNLLGPQKDEHKGRKTLVLDLDETLIHSSMQKDANHSFSFDVNFGGETETIYVAKRPHVDAFLEEMGKIYEVVVWTASVPDYANIAIDKLDTSNNCHHRLFREHCLVTEVGPDQEFYAKEIGRLGRKKEDVIIIDDNPNSYFYNPLNAIPIPKWVKDPNDTALKDVLPLLKNSLLK